MLPRPLFKNPYIPLASLAVALMIAMMLAWTLRYRLDPHEGTAAWVQAVGSIGAIVIAALIADANFAEDRDHHRKAEQELKESVAVLARHCLDRLDYLIDRVRPGPRSGHDVAEHYTASDFEGPLDGLAAIPLHTLGDAGLITAVIDLRREMGRIKARLDACKTDPVVHKLEAETIQGFRTPIFNAMASIMRIAVPGAETNAQVSHLAARAKGPAS